jgi:hypothetical protein
MKICIVSPHLDDAILSCGILMQRRRAAGDEVLSLNIFTAGTNGENRKVEEKNAAAEIGAAPFFLDELDAPDRNPVYWSTVKLFWGDFAEVPADYIDKVESRVRAFLAEHKVDEAYFPLGAGGHIDHRIAHEVGRRIAHGGGRDIKNMPVRFYEDRPYILWPGVLQGRVSELGMDAALPRITGKAMAATLGDYHYLKFFVPEGEYQQACLPLYYAAAERASARSLPAESETLAPATEAELRKVYAALACYESQMHLIYADYENFVKDNMAYERANSGRDVYAERFWSLARHSSR